MKRSVLIKTKPFYAFHLEKKNNTVLNGIISLFLFLDAQRIGEEEAFFPQFFIILSLSQNQKTNDPTWPFTNTTMPCKDSGGCAVAAPCMPPCPAPWEDRAGWPSLPLTINTEGVQRRKGEKGERSWKDFFERESEEKPRERPTVFLRRKGETEG